MSEIHYALNPWWEKKEFDTGISRADYIDKLTPLTKRKQVEVLIGSRRAGKTTLLKQLIKNVLATKVEPSTVLYLALDHPQLVDKTITEHVRYFRQLFQHPRRKKLWLFLDEVQESRDWQGEIKALFDQEDVKIICTGSTISLIQGQGGKLTGRQIVTTVYPLSFKEFLTFKGDHPGPAEEYNYVGLAEEYLRGGGYPENVLQPSQIYLSSLLDDILVRDIARLVNIRKAGLLKDLFRLTAASVGSRVSYNKMAHTLGTALETVKEYLALFESAFLTKTLTKWTRSHSERIYAGRKIYLVDTGLKTILTGPGDIGAKAENAVFSHLARNVVDMGYFAHSQKEVDFVLGENVGLPIEVKYDSAIDISDKRLAGLRLFVRRNPKSERAIVVTKDYQNEIQSVGVTFEFIPLWRFLLSPPPGVLPF